MGIQKLEVEFVDAMTAGGGWPDTDESTLFARAQQLQLLRNEIASVTNAWNGQYSRVFEGGIWSGGAADAGGASIVSRLSAMKKPDEHLAKGFAYYNWVATIVENTKLSINASLGAAEVEFNRIRGNSSVNQQEEIMNEVGRRRDSHRQIVSGARGQVPQFGQWNPPTSSIPPAIPAQAPSGTGGAPQKMPNPTFKPVSPSSASNPLDGFVRQPPPTLSTATALPAESSNPSTVPQTVGDVPTSGATASAAPTTASGGTAPTTTPAQLGTTSGTSNSAPQSPNSPAAGGPSSPASPAAVGSVQSSPTATEASKGASSSSTNRASTLATQSPSTPLSTAAPANSPSPSTAPTNSSASAVTPASPSSSSASGAAAAPAPVPVSTARAERDAILAASTPGGRRKAGDGDPLQRARHIGAALNVGVMDFGFFWVTGVTADGTIVVANSYGLAYIPDGVHLPEHVKMATADESITPAERATWATYPILAVQGWCRHHDKQLRAVVATEEQFANFDPGVAKIILTTDDIPDDGTMNGRSRLEVIAPDAAQRLDAVADTALTELLPPAATDLEPPADQSAKLWFDVAKPLMSTSPQRGAAHLHAFVAYANHAQELALHRAQTAAEPDPQRRAITDWIYWQHLGVLMNDAVASEAPA